MLCAQKEQRRKASEIFIVSLIASSITTAIVANTVYGRKVLPLS